MVQINVSQQLKSPVGSVQDHKVDAIVAICGGNSPVQGEVTLLRTNRGILVKGRLQTEVELTCSRCLISFSCPLTLNIEDEYFPTTDIITGAALPSPDEPDYFTIDGHNIIDLTEAIRQYAIMAIPMKPLCTENCAGICPGCGRNLNQVSCNCPPQTAAPHWLKLIELTLADNDAPAGKTGSRVKR